jgi:hypothetical protein
MNHRSTVTILFDTRLCGHVRTNDQANDTLANEVAYSVKEWIVFKMSQSIVT